MDFSILTEDGLQMLLAWVHFLAGVMWIGLLYYFNVVQVPFMAEAPAEAKPGVTRMLLPRALWWFRWGAMFTLLTGLAIIGVWMHEYGPEFMMSSRGVGISLGALLGIIMFLNVWLVIWPKQKVVIASANAVANGGQADPAAAGAAARAFMASRTNFLFSIPLLFFMGNHRITFFSGNAEGGKVGMALGICTAIILLVEANALMGTKGKGPAKMLDKHIAVLHVGLLLAVVFYFVVDGLL